MAKQEKLQTIISASQSIAEQREMSPIEAFQFTSEQVSPILGANNKLISEAQSLMGPMRELAVKFFKQEMDRIVSEGGSKVADKIGKLTEQAKDAGIFEDEEEIIEEEPTRTRSRDIQTSNDDESGCCGGSSGCS